MAGTTDNPLDGPLASNPTPRSSRFGKPAPIKSSLKNIGIRQNVFRAKLIFYLFLASLGIFFFAGMLSYYIIRTQSFQPITREYLNLRLPTSFWVSTITLLFISGFLQRAVWCIRREKQVAFRRYLILAWLSAFAFLVIQYSGMHSLYNTHFTMADGSTKAYGLCFTMAFLHALHVVGGMVFLGFIIYRGFANKYDHEHNYAVEHCAAYWHFLDVVWVAMLITFAVTG